MTHSSTSSKQNSENLVTVHKLGVSFPIHSGLFRKKTGDIKAVDNVSFAICLGETLGLVGESGSGKTTIAKALLRLHPATHGSIHIGKTNITKLNSRAMRKIRPNMQMIFQNTHASLNPRMTIKAIIQEPLDEHTNANAKDKAARVYELMDLVGLGKHLAKRYPHQLSGGQCQRAGIARALALNPQVIICDEPVAALDVSIQAQIINLLEELQKTLGISYLFISHDLSVIRHISDRVMVIYLGKIVELAPNDILYDTPSHPYTQALLSAIPVPDPEHPPQPLLLKDELSSPSHPQKGCHFSPRCLYAFEYCFTHEPVLQEISPRHFVACHLCEIKATTAK